MLKLFHWFTSTCSKRVRICLAEKELQWESQHVRLDKLEHLSPEYVKLNPEGVVPTLLHDGRVLIESNFIMEYLDEVFPEIPLRPADPFERAQMRIWMDRCEHVLHKSVNAISFVRQGRYKRYEGKSEEELQAIFAKQPSMEKRSILERRIRHGVSEEEMNFGEARIAIILNDMEDCLTRRPWLCGNDYSLADITYAPFFDRFQANNMEQLVDWSARPALGDWWARTQERAGFKKGFFFPDPDA